MNRVDRQTAIAFGEILDRDAQAEFGAGLDLSSALASKVKAASTKVATAYAAPGGLASQVKAATAPKPAAKLSGSVSLSSGAAAPKPANLPAVTASLAPKVVKAAVPPAPARPVLPAGMSAPTAAQTAAAAKLTSTKPGPQNVPKSSAPAYPNVSNANFLEPGKGPIAAPPVLAPKLTAAQQAANAKAVVANKAAEIKLAAEKTAQANVQYSADRVKADQATRALDAKLLATDPHYAALRKASSEARTDWGLIPAGAAVLAAGAAIIATGGAAAGAIAAPSAATVAGAAVAADRALAAAEKAKLSPKGVSGKVDAVVKAGVKAQAVLDTTAKLAAAGVPGAVEGLKVIAQTAADRALNGALPGMPQNLTAQGALDYASYLGNAPALASALTPAQAAATQPAGLAALAKRKPVGVNVSPAQTASKAKLVGSFDGLPSRPRWLVSSAGKVTDIDVTPSAVNGAGWVVWTSGKVVKQ